MPIFNQPRSTFADGVGGGPGSDSERPDQTDPEQTDPDQVYPDQVDEAVSSALLGEAMIERAKSVVVVARRCDEDQAAQILLDAADKAHIPVRVAADQVMTALVDDEHRGGITQDMLMHALGCVRPVQHDRRGGQPGDDGDPLPTGPPAHQAA